ncbi:oligosaccharide flippase family protein [Vibrio parahaemolyticus]|nr:oligosaccharide flippase family protein [Vibrio parahaemolyticus]
MVSDSPLSVSWVVSYSLYFIPVMLFPSWLTFKSIKINHVIMLWVVRAIGLIYIFLYPSLESLVLVSIVNMVMTVFLLFLMNKDEKIISYPTLSGIYFVINMLKEVFVSKTLSFVIYSSIPIIIAAIYGNSSSALYILGERLKSMYSTLFQPIIQTLYLWGFDKKNNIKISNKSLISMLIGLNLLVAITVYLILKTDIIYQYINRLKDVIDVNLYIIAAFLSVMTSILLYFIVFPKGYYKLFRLATYFQLIVFVILFIIAKISISLPASYILTLGELSIFICISSQLFINYKNKKVLK